MRRTEKLLKALANQRRLDIALLLRRRGAFAVGEVARAIGLSVRSTSKHLHRLAAVEVVEAVRYRKEVRYRLLPPATLVQRILREAEREH